MFQSLFRELKKKNRLRTFIIKIARMWCTKCKYWFCVEDGKRRHWKQQEVVWQCLPRIQLFYKRPLMFQAFQLQFRIFTLTIILFLSFCFMCLYFLSWGQTSKSCSVWWRTLWMSLVWGWKTFKTCMKSPIT